MIEAAILYKRIVFDSSIVMLFVDDYGGSLLSSSCELIFLVHGQGQTNKVVIRFKRGRSVALLNRCLVPRCSNKYLTYFEVSTSCYSKVYSKVPNSATNALYHGLRSAYQRGKIICIIGDREKNILRSEKN